VSVPQSAEEQLKDQFTPPFDGSLIAAAVTFVLEPG
jgi:hypothetical protein